ncbi:hypothetical protein Y032_0120g953 [Ancylostoma ceylanicum]|uniref:Uncharacterized protein n=1 Tax=Ancylostoma ceylanicum TaxID=53326 RepID=A0A016TAT9_9BILA|nr:hypothetical protein Y032_0120g953 [Ancylostoma ceylanicum]
MHLFTLNYWQNIIRRWPDRLEEDTRLLKLTDGDVSIEGNGATTGETPSPALGNMARMREKKKKEKKRNKKKNYLRNKFVTRWEQKTSTNSGRSK